jgi:hypothetical protein
MPTIWMPEAELKALQAVFRTSEQVDWEAYKRAKVYVLSAVFEGSVEELPVTGRTRS